jgi:hypothetical protein
MSIKLASSNVTDIRLGSSYVNSMFLESTLVYSNAFSASGGTVSTFTSGSDTYVYHTFTGNGTFSVTTGTTNTAQVLVVGGGAGSPYGGFYNNGGGGGGANYSQSVSLVSGSYTVTVGTGGSINSNGNNSEFSGSGLSIAAGGGGVSGVSGTPQSNGTGTNAVDRGAGGGGAGAVGGNATGGAGGKGGDGLYSVISGTGTYYGAGGGGGVNSYSNVYTPGAGGANNGGVGGSRTANPGAGTVYGGAAGGTGYYPNSGGTTGGAGVVIITYRQTGANPTPPPGPPTPKNILPITASAGTLVIWSDTTSLTSSVLYDKSGNANNALVSGSTLALTGSNGFMFNGTNNYLNWATTLVGQPSSSYSIQYYGTPFSSSVNYDFFCKDFYTNGWDFIYEPGPTKIAYRDNAGNDKTSSLFTPSTTTKQQIVLTVNATTNVIEFYRNGAFVGNFNRTTDVVNNFNDFASPFKFGFNTNTDATYFKGSLASVALYNKVISATDVFYNWGQLTGSSF